MGVFSLPLLFKNPCSKIINRFRDLCVKTGNSSNEKRALISTSFPTPFGFSFFFSFTIMPKVRKITMPSFFPRKVTQALCLRHEVFSFANKTDQTIICWHLLVFHNKAINGPKSRMKSKWCLSEPSGFNLWPQVGEVKQKKRREIERYVVPLYYAAYFRPILDRKI